MGKRMTGGTSTKGKLPNITDSGFVDIKEAPVIYAYIYDVEAMDAEKFNKNYSNTITSKNTVEISGFELADNEVIAKPKK
jgi:hypothetical protein